MRVITPYGFGTTEGFRPKGSNIEVELDEAFLGEKTQTLRKGATAFPFTDWASVRVLNVEGSGWFSNLQFHESHAEGRMQMLLPAPPDETIFFLDLATGRIELSQELGLLAQDFLLLRPWLDRWGPERTDPFEDRDEAVITLETEIGRMAGATGISTSALIDVQARKLIRFYLIIAPPQGVILRKEY